MAAIVDHLWQSLLVCAAVSTCAFSARGSRATFRLWLWRAAALKFLFPFAVIHALGEWLGFPVAYAADPAPPALTEFVGALTPLFAPGGMLQLHAAWAWCVPPLALLASALCMSGVISRLSAERRHVREEWERRQRDIDDVRRCPGFWATASMLFSALAIVCTPLLSGALADRQRRHELLIANSLSLRQGRIDMTVAAPGMGTRYDVIADEDGVVVRNANLIDIVAIVYAIPRSAVWTEQRSSADPAARPNFWMIWPRYDVRLAAPVRDPGEFDPYALRQPLTKLLAERFGLEINLDNKCQPPCGNYGVAMPADAL